MIAPHRIKLPNGGEVHISSMWRAKVIHESYEWVVSLLDPCADPGFRHKGVHQIYTVDDTEHPTQYDVLLTREEIETMLKLRVSPGKKGLVHCHAGVSRSTAMGSMIAFQNGASLEDIRNGLDWSIADPNMLILGWSGIIFGTDMTTPVNKWYRETHEEVDNGPYSSGQYSKY